PGLSSTPLTLVEAVLMFMWEDIGDPIGLLSPDVVGTNATGNLLAEFLNLDFDQYFLELLARLDELGTSISGITPLDKELPVVNTSINGLFTGDPYKIGSLLMLHDPVDDYFTDIRDKGGFPSLSRLVEIIIEDTDKKLDGSALGASLDYNDGNPELSFTMGVSVAPELTVDLDLGSALQDIGLDVTASATVRVRGEINLFATVGIDINSVLDPNVTLAESVFFELGEVIAVATLSVFDIDLNMDLGFVQASIEDAAFSLYAGVRLKLNEPDGRLTLAELRAGDFKDLFSISVDDIKVQMAVAFAEAFVGVGRDVESGKEGTGILVTIEDLGFIVYGHFPSVNGELQAPEFDYALTGSGSGEILGIPDVV
ncbi:MAG: hypothetical protein KAT30_05335, partial [Candidatus Krumholzibacteria bacterium]|nr:hypothetical protein [Candidatus Krumholzibacteria bacterium]